LIRQQPAPPQQSAEREVALAVPTSARAATIANRYFMGILQLSFLSALAPAVAGTSQRDRTESGARRWNWRTLRAAVLGRNVSGKSFVADRRVNERRGERGKKGKAEGAESATLLLLVRFRRVPVAFVRGRFRFHFRAAIRLLKFRNERLPRDRREADRAGEEQAKQESESSSHQAQGYHAGG